MSNRADRRKAMRNRTEKHKALIASYTQEQRYAELIKNGLTPADMQKAYDEGFDAGYMAAAVPTMRSCYAAVCLALMELYGFGEKRCIRVLKLTDEKTNLALVDDELVQEVFDRIGLQIDFKDAMERVKGRDDV